MSSSFFKDVTFGSEKLQSVFLPIFWIVFKKLNKQIIKESPPKNKLIVGAWSLTTTDYCRNYFNQSSHLICRL